MKIKTTNRNILTTHLCDYPNCKRETNKYRKMLSGEKKYFCKKHAEKLNLMAKDDCILVSKFK